MKILSIVLIAIFLAGCAHNLSSNSYQLSAVGESVETYQGIVISKRVVEVEGDGSNTKVGSLVGGTVGAMAGSAIGKGTGKIYSTLAGAVLGGVGGGVAANKLTDKEALAYKIKLSNGTIKTVVQGKDIDISVGTRVFVEVAHDGRSIVTIDDSGLPMDVQEEKNNVQIVKHR